MIVKYIVFSNIISVVSDNILRICIQEPLLIPKKLQSFFILYQHITAYSSAIKFTCLIPGNVCVPAEGTLKSMKTLVLIRHHAEIILQKSTIVLLNCRRKLHWNKSLLSLIPTCTKSYTEIKAWQLKFP